MINRLEIGEYVFEDDTIFRISPHNVIDLSGGELAEDTLDVTVRCSDTELADVPFGTPCIYYHKDELQGRYYISEIKRVGKTRYEINATSFVGVLGKSYHSGGLYTQSTFSEVLSDIIGGSVNYSVGVDVDALNVTGWLPHATRRDNLHQLLLSYGVGVVKDAIGNPVFTIIRKTDAIAIPKARVFQGGTIEYTKAASKISVTEHSFAVIGDEESVTLYDNTGADKSSIDTIQVWFDNAPIQVSTLTATGGILVSNATVNGCTLTKVSTSATPGVGTLTGLPYTHITNIVSAEDDEAEEVNEISVSDATLVNQLNSAGLLFRLQAYYGKHNVISTTIKVDGEHCGATYSLQDPFGDAVSSAFMTKMDTNVSTFNKAVCELVDGYEPSGSYGIYKHCKVLDKDTFAADGGVFTVPSEVLTSDNPSMRIIIIGGGSGGDSGYPGYNGTGVKSSSLVDPDSMQSIIDQCTGGDGGDGGNAGNPGRVRSIIIDNPASTYLYTIGSGGNGGAQTGFRKDTLAELRKFYTEDEKSDDELQDIIDAEQTDFTGENNKGAAGTASTFGTYSSADAGSYIPSGGVYNPLNGKIYAHPGYRGIKGGDGDKPSSDSSIGGDVMYRGIRYHGGNTGFDWMSDFVEVYGSKYAAYAGSGHGAGAAVGLDRSTIDDMDGEDYVTSTVSASTSGTVTTVTITAQAGKSGSLSNPATGECCHPTARAEIVAHGGGGHGGHGGGGGGAAGIAFSVLENEV